MLGWLVINSVLTSSKFQENYQLIRRAASEQGIQLITKTDIELLYVLNDVDHLNRDGKPDFVFFWDKDIFLAKYLESMGLLLFNNASAIENASNKALSHIILDKAGIRMPKTIIAPRKFNNFDFNQVNFIYRVVEELRFPLVIKGCYGAFGINVFLANNTEEALKIANRFQHNPFLFQEYIPSKRGCDVRVNVVGNEVIAGMLRFSGDSGFITNISNGGIMRSYEPTYEQKDLAIRACREFNLEFAGVDLLIGPDDEPMVCEVNSNAHFKNMTDCTGVDIAAEIIHHIQKQIMSI